MVWVFGEALGGILAPGATWLFGTPGAVLIYCIAGILIALPERAFATARLGRVVLGVGGLFLIGMAVLQAWPGRGFWQGRGGAVTAMVGEMSRTPQPGFLSSWLASFGSFDAAHGWAVNLFVVVALAVIGVLLVTGRRPYVLGALIGLAVLCLADWVLVQDLGFLGGVGTDPNSMLPMALLFVAGYVAAFRVPVEAAAPTTDPGAAETSAWWQHATPSYVTRSVAAIAAIGVVIVGTAPMAMAAVNQNADPILTEALDGTPNALDTPAPPFSLTDQYGHQVNLASLRGHAVALTFLDPVCTSDCPLIAQEFRQADQQLGSQARQVDFVAIVANPIYRSASFTKQFDRQEGLTQVANWYYLTGSLPAARARVELLRDPGRHRGERGHDCPQRPGVRHRLAGSGARRPHRRPGSDPDVRLVLLFPSAEPDPRRPSFVRSLVDRGWKRCSGLSGWFAVVPIVSGLLLAAPALSADAATVRAPLTSAVSTSSDSWLMLPMGELSDPSNTFWQLLHAAPGSSHWSVVTPEGSQTTEACSWEPPAGPLLSGSSRASCSTTPHWPRASTAAPRGAPSSCPAGLTARPDALAYGSGPGPSPSSSGTRCCPPHRACRAGPCSSPPPGSPAPSRAAGSPLSTPSPSLPTGSPLVATGCRNGVVGMFTKQGGAWRSVRDNAAHPVPLGHRCAPAASLRHDGGGARRRRPGVGGEPWSPCGARVAHRGRRPHPSPCPAGPRSWPVPSGRAAPWPWSSAPTKSA